MKDKMREMRLRTKQIIQCIYCNAQSMMNYRSSAICRHQTYILTSW